MNSLGDPGVPALAMASWLNHCRRLPVDLGTMIIATASWALYLWFFTIPIVAIALTLIYLAWGVESRRRTLTACLVPAIVPGCIMALGVIFAHPQENPPAPWLARVDPESVVTVLGYVLASILPLALANGFWARRILPAAYAAFVFWAWIALIAWILATMTVRGSYL